MPIHGCAARSFPRQSERCCRCCPLCLQEPVKSLLQCSTRKVLTLQDNPPLRFFLCLRRSCGDPFREAGFDPQEDPPYKQGGYPPEGHHNREGTCTMTSQPRGADTLLVTGSCVHFSSALGGCREAVVVIRSIAEKWPFKALFPSVSLITVCESTQSDNSQI